MMGEWLKQYVTKNTTKYLVAWIEMFGIILFAIGANSLVGHTTEHEKLYRWSKSDPGMGIASATATTIEGITIFLIGITFKRHEKTDR